MAQKAAKQTAKQNATTLTNLHLISLGINMFFILYRFLWHYNSVSRGAILKYGLLNSPALVVEWYLEKLGRPADGRKKGDDVNAGGLMEMMWDVVYWTWGCMLLVALFGERMWWLYTIIPVYGVYSAYTTMTGMKQQLGGMGGAANDMSAGNATGVGVASKRQTKMEKRGTEGKVKYGRG